MLKPILIFSILFSLYITSNSQSCTTYNFANNQIFSSCNDLPNLNSYLHWNYDQSTKTLHIAYRHTNVSADSWVAWAINPTGHGMVGSQALVAFQQSDGTMRAYTSPVESYGTQLEEGDLSFPVSGLSATYAKNEITIFATLMIGNLSSTLNQVWQDGPVSENTPGMHPISGANVKSMGTVNLLSGQTRTVSSASSSMTKKRNIHGLLNAVSWGILLPVGAISARYLKVFPTADPAWFYIHATCQTSAFIVGIAGVVTGLRLGSQSPGVQYKAHRVIGIVLICLATLQVLALFLRPKKDHKLRFYWNVYHHSLGYSLIILSIINIFKGFNILNNPNEIWKRAYVGILIGLAVVAAVLEVYTWFVVVKRKMTHKGVNGTNEDNGYEEKEQATV